MALHTHNIRVEILAKHVIIVPRECRRSTKVVQRENFHHILSLCAISSRYVVYTKRTVEHSAILNITYTAAVVHRPVHGLRRFIPLSSKYFPTALHASS